jgi:TorA maturation chaperone TorD
MSADFNSRAQLYALLARLFLEELDRPLALYLRGLPGLAEHIPPDPAVDDWLGDLRAEHQWLFGLNVYPYEAIFRDRDLMLNTASTSRVVALYEACGFAPAARLRAGAPDHLGVELALMAELTSRLPHDPAARSRIAELLHRHLAAWLPPCSEALARVARAPLYRALAEIATELVLADLERFPAPETSEVGRATRHKTSQNAQISEVWRTEAYAPSPQRESGLGGEGLEDERGLRPIVRRLLTPDDVGVFISRADIAAVGHALALPAPIAEREQMLVALFGAAGQFELVPALLAALGGLLRGADGAYARLAADHPAWVTQGRVWRGRVAAGLVLLDDLAREHHDSLRHET